MSIQGILSIVFISSTAAFGYLNYKTYSTIKKTVPHEQILIETDQKKNEIIKKKYTNMIETDVKTLTFYKKFSKTETIPSPIPIMIRKDSILEEKPSPMPVWVVTMTQQDPQFIYFIGTRTKANDLKQAQEDSKKLSFEELFKYIGVKMDYEMRIETVSSEEQSEIQEKRFQEIQSQVLGNLGSVKIFV